jgi:hypothetical protein
VQIDARFRDAAAAGVALQLKPLQRR